MKWNPSFPKKCVAKVNVNNKRSKNMRQKYECNAVDASTSARHGSNTIHQTTRVSVLAINPFIKIGIPFVVHEFCIAFDLP